MALAPIEKHRQPSRMSQITSRAIEANGLTFQIDECGEGDRVALFLHGFPESKHSWRFQLPLLAKLGWRAVAVDQRGYGHSSRPKGVKAYDIGNLTADAGAVFDALGARRRLLIAHDWGAIVAWAFAMDRVRDLDGLVIMNVPHPAVFAADIKTNPAQRKRSWYVFFFQIPWLPEWVLTRNRARAIGRAFTDMAVDKSRFPPAVVDHYRQNALLPGAATAMVNWYRAGARNGLAKYGPGRAPVIETPTLMIWGEEDSALGIELTQGYGPYVTDFTLHRLPGVSHWVQQEAPEAVNARLGAWVREREL